MKHCTNLAIKFFAAVLLMGSAFTASATNCPDPQEFQGTTFTKAQLNEWVGTYVATGTTILGKHKWTVKMNNIGAESNTDAIKIAQDNLVKLSKRSREAGYVGKFLNPEYYFCDYNPGVRAITDGKALWDDWLM